MITLPSPRFLLRLCLLFLCACGGMARPGLAAESVRTTVDFDADWLFNRGDVPDAEDPQFDDVNWASVNLPHDWAIAGPADQNAAVGRGGGYRPSGVSWYRKRFALPDDVKGRRVFVEFDGVMANCEVWLNGQPVGRHAFGYTSFALELTGWIKPGDDETNILAVRTDTTTQPDSRWYTGQGIYRHVRLVVTDAVRVVPWGLTITTPELADDHALVHLRTTVENGSSHPRLLAVTVELFDPRGLAVGRATTAPRMLGIGETADFAANLTVAAPQRWDIGQGHVYHATATVLADDQPLDDAGTTFGFREARFEAATGFWLNGRNLKLQGVALHHDGGAVGAAVPLDVWRRRLERLRAVGVNAIRTAHNPPAPDFLALCDELGFVVMDELFDAWTRGKPHAEEGYHRLFLAESDRDARDTVQRDRNHPSIILWSTGNEIHDTPNAALAKRLLAHLIGLVHAEDPTRPVTQALFRPNTSHDYTNGLADMLDVIGTNYRDRELLVAWKAKPTRRILGTEQDHERTTWLLARDNPPHAGQFLWAGVDYLGEADWPFLTSSSGLLDRTGRLYPRAYQRQSWWTTAPMVRIARHEPALANSDPRRRPGFDLSCDWTPVDPAASPLAELEVYTNAAEVELFLNDQSLGTQQAPTDASPCTWTVPFAAGSLRAAARTDGEVVATHALHTAGPPARLELTIDRASLPAAWDHVAFATVTAVDAAGHPCPWADDLVTFQLTGPGAMAGVDNGDRADPSPYQTRARKLYRGQCVVLLQADAPDGTLTLTANARGLTSVHGSVATVAP